MKFGKYIRFDVDDKDVYIVDVKSFNEHYVYFEYLGKEIGYRRKNFETWLRP